MAEVSGALTPFVRIDQRGVGDIATNSHLRYEAIDITGILTLNTGTFTSSWPYDVDLLSNFLFGGVVSGAAKLDDGDTVRACIESPGAVGTLTSGTLSTDTVIDVDAAALAEVDRGDFIEINGDSVWHHVIAKDEGNSTLTLESQVSNTYASSNAIKLRRYFLGTPDAGLTLIPGLSALEWGRDALHSAHIQTGYLLILEYYNAGLSTKNIHGQLAILY